MTHRPLALVCTVLAAVLLACGEEDEVSDAACTPENCRLMVEGCEVAPRGLTYECLDVFGGTISAEELEAQCVRSCRAFDLGPRFSCWAPFCSDAEATCPASGMERHDCVEGLRTLAVEACGTAARPDEACAATCASERSACTFGCLHGDPPADMAACDACVFDCHEDEYACEEACPRG